MSDLSSQLQILFEESTTHVKTKTDTDCEWEDITEFMQETSNDLAVGQIIKDSVISLYDAMSALELMDSKMDPGVNANHVIILEEGLEQGIISKSSELSPKEILGVMDKLLECEFLWYSGYPITQTLLTCLYIHDINRSLDDPLLKPFTIALLNRASIVRQAILNADIYHEDDFIAHLFGYNFPVHNPKSVLQILKNVENDLVKQQTTNSNENNEAEIHEALLSRIKFSRIFYSIVQNITKPACRGIIQSKKLINTIKSQIEILQKTNQLGELPANIFQPEICRRLTYSSHPRAVPKITFTDVIQHVNLMVSQLEYLCDITTHTTFEKLEHVVLHITDNNAGIFVRSVFINLVWSENKIFGQFPVKDWVLQNARDTFGIPEKYFQYEKFSDYLQSIEKMHIRELGVLASNKARRQRKLSHLMREWAYLAEEGDRVDTDISQSLGQSKTDSTHYFYCWNFDKTLRNMLWWLKLGYELGLYDEYEHHMIYWYLDDLHTQRIRNHTYILAFNNAHKARPGKKKGRNAKEKKAPTIKNEKTLHTPYHLELQSEAHICRSIYLLLSILKKENLYPEEPNFQFGTPQTRFETRFDPFYKMRVPQPHWYKQYEDVKLPSLSLDQFLGIASEAIQNGKGFIERYSNLQDNSKLKLDELKVLFKVAIANALFIMQFKKQKKKPSIEFSYHPAFPVLKL